MSDDTSREDASLVETAELVDASASDSATQSSDVERDVPRAPIGVFDSGVGGLSVLLPLRGLLPFEDILFVADQAHVPYGARPLSEVREFATGISRLLIDKGAKLIIVACNTASAAALQHLRREFPQVPFVGMEPAVKPAAARTRTRTVGVLATPATFQGELYASVVERFAQGVTVLQQTLPGLVDLIEAGDIDGSETRRIVAEGVGPLVEQGADTLVLACTHYPFVIDLVEEAAGTDVPVINPAAAIAQQAARVLEAGSSAATHERPGVIEFVTSGDPEVLSSIAWRLIGEKAPVRRMRWVVKSATE